MHSDSQLPPEQRPPAEPAKAMLLPSMESALFINEIAEAIVATLDPTQLIPVVTEKVKQLLCADDACLLTAEPGGALAVQRDGQTTLVPPGEGVAGWVAQHGKPAFIPDTRNDLRYRPRAERPVEARSVAAVPLFIGTELCGVLEAVTGPDSLALTAESLEALLWLAPHVALAVKNARTNAELLRSHEAIRRANEELERKIVERTEQIGRAKREWEKTFDAISEPLFLIDGFAIRRANTALSTLSGTPIRQVIGQPCYQVLAGRTSPCVGCPLVAHATSGEVTMRGRLYRGAFFPLDDGGVVAHYRDVTDSRRLEDQLRESQRMASVGQLAAGAAHEINNPLGFLISNLNTLEGYFDEIRRTLAQVSALQTLVQSGQAERALDVLRGPDLVQGLLYEALEDAPAIIRESRDGGRRVHEIVKALKELSAIDTTDRRTAEDPWTMVERAAKRAGLPPGRITEAERTKVQVLVEPLQLEIALANILRNAMQASDDDTPVQIGVGREGDWAVISISDSGVGMTPEVRGRVFDPFFTTRGVGGGLGLGLTAAYGIVTRHGGSISLESEPGMGTQVLIRLPAVPAAP